MGWSFRKIALGWWINQEIDLPADVLYMGI
jgi:hypothetical protein